MAEEIIICRCEDVTLEQIRSLIQAGFDTLEEIKRMARCGMGSCQGRTCTRLITHEIARLTGREVGELIPFTHRPPVIPVSIKTLAKVEQDD
jgi:bacterioferritin-associated ferredoxin